MTKACNVTKWGMYSIFYIRIYSHWIPLTIFSTFGWQFGRSGFFFCNIHVLIVKREINKYINIYKYIYIYIWYSQFHLCSACSWVTGYCTQRVRAWSWCLKRTNFHSSGNPSAWERRNGSSRGLSEELTGALLTEGRRGEEKSEMETWSYLK